ncbi:MAG: NIL domain-containing protein [Candidatus Caldatribacteriaceae bacterium]
MSVATKVVLRFPSDIADQPLVCELALQFGLRFNILRASISPHREGIMVMEIIGEEKEEVENGLQYLRRTGIGVESLSQDIRMIEARCVHCGSCVGVCPTGALSMERPSYLVRYDEGKCIACEMCVLACPTHAMEAVI